MMLRPANFGKNVSNSATFFSAFDVPATLSVIFKAALKPLAIGFEATSGHQTIICGRPELMRWQRIS
jgi:hypothetical protein